MTTHIESRTVECCGGKKVTTYTLSIEKSLRVEVCDWGATITKIFVPNKDKSMYDIVLGFDDLERYILPSNAKIAIGGTLGRVANRIKNGRFVIPKVVDGRRDSAEGTIYRATKNDGDNTLNGGEKGLHQRSWESKIENENTVKMWYESPDGEEGFPGRVLIEVFFTVVRNGYNTAQFVIVYKATTDANVITPVSLTSTPFFNLSGHEAGPESVYKHRFQVHCDEYVELDDQLCPTGNLKPVDESPYDMRDFDTFKARIDKSPKNGFDCVFAIQDAVRDVHLRNVAYVLDDASGIYMEVMTDHPTLYFNTLNINEDIKRGKNNCTYKRHGGFTLSPQMYPDAGNHSNFPTILIADSKPYCFMNCYLFGTIYH
ncbi:galactose mutarotase isoform X2 [Nilaparvata lugens]|uniref:galactose mutarotase isoform X2 n=1 Tax=Nilaparvata lugens TaxID=108931 RepID=UPI000B98EBDF|nr:galactose mutarotase isoform X2 [Nilaparvata lugens]XP_039294928.1 galactose mutarotase isoform X1 [Nilaparvata lugens]XP_039294930.1 galactose mutarotase isoform X1 [Nilaparvata lugens]XP_039294931.1 galactose mutarotase isoform X1 [Nilaparvata lugens]XP_039294932.1 galactose mutarotase isoform X1 [Nilaparvata lugens]XP_039294933.1 galactose mutarotase isoform X1 [Nilaparvata lugens]XP_039294934.1 galactose mutarotase isoform X2 [Nilaparvata lugens]XP_039294935.1 galactose mutarotase iso